MKCQRSRINHLASRNQDTGGARASCSSRMTDPVGTGDDGADGSGGKQVGQLIQVPSLPQADASGAGHGGWTHARPASALASVGLSSQSFPSSAPPTRSQDWSPEHSPSGHSSACRPSPPSTHGLPTQSPNPSPWHPTPTLRRARPSAALGAARREDRKHGLWKFVTQRPGAHASSPSVFHRLSPAGDNNQTQS